MHGIHHRVKRRHVEDEQSIVPLSGALNIKRRVDVSHGQQHATAGRWLSIPRRPKKRSYARRDLFANDRYVASDISQGASPSKASYRGMCGPRRVAGARRLPR